jgi:tryptophan synthase alpha chain
MNRIDQLFSKKKEGVLSIYMTAGYPELDDTVKIIRALERNGVDIIEIGMPFSDPLADGEIIQKSSHIALKNGMNILYLFEQISNIREHVDIPLVIMGYLNPVLQFGFSRFVEKCVETGIDGLILPDLPLQIYDREYRNIVENAGLKFIMLITPYTSDERIEKIISASGGFLYVVADSSTTGARKEITEIQMEYFRRIKQMNHLIPRMIGFGISNAETFSKACEYGNGAIIGSAFIQALDSDRDRTLEERIRNFIGSVLTRNPY